MEPTHDASEEWENKSVKSWMVEYTVEVGGEANRHLSMIMLTTSVMFIITC